MASGSYGSWVDAKDGQFPPEAVVGGHEKFGQPLYVARASFMKDVIPGKLNPALSRVYVPWGGKEHAIRQYQVLVGGPNKWVSTSGSDIPSGAFPGGEKKGEPLYIGRFWHDGSLVPGMVQKSKGVCCISYNGLEFKSPDYEILTY